MVCVCPHPPGQCFQARCSRHGQPMASCNSIMVSVSTSCFSFDWWLGSPLCIRFLVGFRFSVFFCLVLWILAALRAEQRVAGSRCEAGVLPGAARRGGAAEVSRRLLAAHALAAAGHRHHLPALPDRAWASVGCDAWRMPGTPLKP